MTTPKEEAIELLYLQRCALVETLRALPTEWKFLWRRILQGKDLRFGPIEIVYHLSEALKMFEESFRHQRNYGCGKQPKNLEHLSELKQLTGRLRQQAIANGHKQIFTECGELKLESALCIFDSATTLFCNFLEEGNTSDLLDKLVEHPAMSSRGTMRSMVNQWIGRHGERHIGQLQAIVRELGATPPLVF